MFDVTTKTDFDMPKRSARRLQDDGVTLQTAIGASSVFDTVPAESFKLFHFEEVHRG